MYDSTFWYYLFAERDASCESKSKYTIRFMDFSIVFFKNILTESNRKGSIILTFLWMKNVKCIQFWWRRLCKISR